jgi:hypothetical protein
MLSGEIPGWVVITLVIPGAYCCFLLGIVLALLSLPQGFDYGSCVISRLCSSFHNPAGHHYMTQGMIIMALALLPAASWLARCPHGCPKLCAWGRGFMRMGFIAMALVGIERAVCPTHGSFYERIHLTLAGLAFIGIWLGIAMLSEVWRSAHSTRVPWRWLWSPPWYLAACILPICVVFSAYLPKWFLPSSDSQVYLALPRAFVFLRTVTFWQWYLVVGLLLSFAFTTLRAFRAQHPELRLGSWRLDSPQKTHPHLTRFWPLVQMPARHSASQHSAG